MRKRLVIVGHSREGLGLIPALEANPAVEITALVGEDVESYRAALRAALLSVPDAIATRVTADLETALAEPHLSAVIDAGAPAELRGRLQRLAPVPIAIPPLARLLYGYGPIRALSRYDLLQTLRSMADSHDLALHRRGLLDAVLQLALGAVDADRGSIMLWDASERALRIGVAVGIEKELLGKIRVRPGEGIAGRSLAAERPLAIHGRAAPDQYRIFRERDDVASALSAPLVFEARVLGVLNLSRMRSRNPFESADLEFIEQLSRVGARLIAGAEEYDALRRESEALRAAARLRQLLARAGPLSDRLQAVCAELAADVHGVVRLFLYDGDLDVLILQAASSGVDALGRRERLRLGDGVVGRVAASRQAALLQGALGDTAGLFAALPLEAEGRLVGVMSFEGFETCESGEHPLARLRAATETLARGVAERLHAARLERATARQLELTRCIGKLAAASDRNAACEISSETALSLLEAQDAVLRLAEDDRDRYRVACWAGLSADRQDHLAALEKELSGEALRHRAPLRVPPRGGGPTRSAAMSEVGAALVQPLLGDERWLGTLSVLGRVPGDPLLGEGFGEEEEGLLQQVAEHLVRSLRRCSAEEEAHSSASSEAGRGGALARWRARLAEEVARSGRCGHALALVYLAFESPWLRGTRDDSPDQAAAAAAAALRGALRPFDVIVREAPSRLIALIPEPEGDIPGLVASLGSAAQRAWEAVSQGQSCELQIGYAAYPSDGTTAEALERRAREPRVRPEPISLP